MTRMTIKFLSSYRHLSGVEQTEIEIPEGSTVADLLKILNEKYPDAPIDRDETIVAINDTVCRRDTVLNDGEKATVFHLMAGG